MKNKYKISLDVCCCGDMPDGVPHVYCNTLAEAQKLMVDLFELGSWDGIPVNYDEKAVVVFAPDDSPVVGLCGINTVKTESIDTIAGLLIKLVKLI